MAPVIVAKDSLEVATVKSLPTGTDSPASVEGGRLNFERSLTSSMGLTPWKGGWPVTTSFIYKASQGPSVTS